MGSEVVRKQANQRHQKNQRKKKCSEIRQGGKEAVSKGGN